MVYIVEDDNNIRELVVYTLSSTGIPAAGFETPSLFWAELKKQPPELVMLDIMLPEEDGLSILEKLRADVRYKNLPVILLTAKGSEYDKVLGFEKAPTITFPSPLA